MLSIYRGFCKLRLLDLPRNLATVSGGISQVHRLRNSEKTVYSWLGFLIAATQMRTLFLTGRSVRPNNRYRFLMAGIALALMIAGVAFWGGLSWRVSAYEMASAVIIGVLAMLIARWRKRRQAQSATQRLKDSALW